MHLAEPQHMAGMLNLRVPDMDCPGEESQIRRALENAGISPDSCPQIAAENNVEGGYGAMKRILAEHPECTGVFCATDTLAIGAANAIVKSGKKIPADISLVGFDGLGHDLLVRPNVTTVRQPVYEIGMRLAETLIARLNGGKFRRDVHHCACALTASTAVWFTVTPACACSARVK